LEASEQCCEPPSFGRNANAGSPWSSGSPILHVPVRRAGQFGCVALEQLETPAGTASGIDRYADRTQFFDVAQHGARAHLQLIRELGSRHPTAARQDEHQGDQSMVWSDAMPRGLFKGVRTYQLSEQGGSTEFSMTEEFSGLLSSLITKVIPDMTESFNQFADGLKGAAEASSG
jgi:hypothetical protein